MCQCCKFYDNKMKNENGEAINYCHKGKCGILDPKSTCEDWEMNKSEIPNVTWHEKTESRKGRRGGRSVSKNPSEMRRHTSMYDSDTASG